MQKSLERGQKRNGTEQSRTKRRRRETEIEGELGRTEQSRTGQSRREQSRRGTEQEKRAKEEQKQKGNRAKRNRAERDIAERNGAERYKRGRKNRKGQGAKIPRVQESEDPGVKRFDKPRNPRSQKQKAPNHFFCGFVDRSLFKLFLVFCVDSKVQWEAVVKPVLRERGVCKIQVRLFDFSAFGAQPQVLS